MEFLTKEEHAGNRSYADRLDALDFVPLRGSNEEGPS